jgi:hypothetical protein
MKAKLAFIFAHMSTYSIRLLCAVLEVGPDPTVLASRVSTLLGLQNTVEPYLRWEYAFSGMPQDLHKRLTVSHGIERGL